MLPDLDFSKGDGLVTIVTQDARTGAVLMVAHADREALERTVATGEMHYRSRTRGLWHKGATSGNVQRVASLTADCEATPSGEGGTSYTRRLLADRNLRFKKLGEECAELVTACADGDRERAVGEGADLMYHMLVALRAVGVSLEDLCVEL